MATFSLILLLAALILFILDGFDVASGGRFKLSSLGLACLTGAALLGGASAISV